MLDAVLGPVLGLVADPVAPGQLWTAWSADPLVVGGLLAAAAAHTTGIRRLPRRPAGWRVAAFWVGLAAVALALVSPLEALAGTLASAHMAQHLLLILVAAPALAMAAPGAALLRGSPAWLRRRLARGRGHLHLGTGRSRQVWGPWAAFLLHVAVLWVWTAQVPHELALRSTAVHAVMHVSVLGAALLLWGVVVGAHGARQVDRGQAMLLVFAAGIQGVLLSALLVFARQPWYAAYGDGPAAWGLTPLADQQVAGAMLSGWGLVVHVSAVLWLLSRWLGQDEGSTVPVAGARSAGPLPVGRQPVSGPGGP